MADIAWHQRSGARQALGNGLRGNGYVRSGDDRSAQLYNCSDLPKGSHGDGKKLIN